MANLTRTNWPLGWLPSNDAVNGNPEGLLRMDNLRIDKNGVVGLIDGQQAITVSFSDFVSALFTKIINNQEYIWAATGNPTSTISRTSSGFGVGASMITSGGGLPTDKACFADALGNVLVCAGTLRTKDPVTVQPLPLGLLTPSQLSGSGPHATVNSQVQITIKCPDKVVVGGGTSPTLVLDPDTFTGAMCTDVNFDTDTTAIGSTPSSNIGVDVIQFPMTVIGKTPSIITRVVLNFVLDGTPNDPSTYQNYYEFNYTSDQLQSGADTQALISSSRSDAIRFGNDSTKDWTSVIGVRFMVVATEAASIKFGDIKIIGGALGGLNGVYNYVQVDVCNNGVYSAKSPVSAPALNTGTNSIDFTVINGSVKLRPIINDINTTEHWFFRQSASDLGIDPNTGESRNTSSLNQYYFVGSTPKGIAFTDSLSDTEVLQLNADGTLLPNFFLKTLRSDDQQNGLQDFIYDMVGLYNERTLYMTSSFIYLSDRLNPDAVDTRYTLRPSGDPSEKNLWIRKMSNGLVILGTTRDLYEISGTLLDLPDGSVDAKLLSIGEAYPPLSMDVCAHDGGLYYIGADGLRVTTGSNSVNLSPQIRHLFQSTVLSSTGSGLNARHGIPGVAIYDGVGVNYSIAAAHNRIYFVLPTQDGSRRIIVFDTVSKTYSLIYTDPVKLYSTQAGELLACYGSGSGNRIFVLDTKQGYGVDGAGMPFKLRTVFDANNQPRNRKDTFTLKLVLDTGGASVSVDIQKDGIGVSETDESNWVNLGRVSANGQQTIYIPLSADNVSLGFRYALQLSDVSGVTTFKLYEYTIEYEPRPEQLNYLRILPTNAGTIARKRWTAFAFTIDTLANPITFTPFLDNVAWGSVAIVTTGTKLTYIFYFNSEALATDIGGILVAGVGGVFEFYGVNLEECVSEKLPIPVTFLIIPPNNYGNPNRKRHTSYKMQLLTRGQNVTFTPIVDGTSHQAQTFNTTTKQTVDYYFPQSDGDVIGVDIGGTLAAQTAVPFEFYGTIIPQTIELLPDRLEYLRIPNNNFGLAARKRIRTISLILDTRGQNVTFTPIVDGTNVGSPVTFNTTGKLTVYYYFTTDVTGIDFGGTLVAQSSMPFEYYGMGTPENVEPLPLPCEYYIIPPSNYGTPNRKRHTSYKFQINTRGSNVVFTPILDGVSYASQTYNTTVKKTVEYFFPAGDVIGVDIGGTLSGVAPFEFYEVVTPQTVEQLPDRLEYLRIPNNNFGVVSRKRIRTIPFAIDTYGQDVTFTPIVDGVLYPTTTFNTIGKTTVYYYFVTDVFGTDFGGILNGNGGNSPFEFYGLSQPEDVEVLPIPKKLDQLGPMRFDKIGKVFGFRVRIIPNGNTTSIPFQIYGDNSQSVPNLNYPRFAGNIAVTPGFDNVYEVQLPKSINTDIFRLVLGPTNDSFHRYDVAVKVQISGMQGQAKWLPIR